ncbi:hypothetical protein X566_22295 [Afipia sp. P52-10]|nr:hypothetical protein X566_22295 [Afipia sp. P52-10]
MENLDKCGLDGAKAGALEGVGEHVRVEVLTQPETVVKSRKSFRKRKLNSCRVGFRRENSSK